jgi:hypothetical protein
MWGSGVIAPQFLILPLDTGEQPGSLHDRSTPGKRTPSTWWIEGWVDHRLTVTLDGRNVSWPCRQQQYNSLAVKPTLQSPHQKSANREMTVAKMYLRFQVFRRPEFSINIYVTPQVPSSLKSTLKSNTWFKRKFSDWRFIRHETRMVTKPVILFEWFGNVVRWSSQGGLKLLSTFGGEELLKKDTEHQNQKRQNQHFCFQLPTYCQEASIYCF